MDGIFNIVIGLIVLIIATYMTIMIKLVYIPVKGMCVEVVTGTMNAAGINYKKSCCKYDYELNGIRYNFSEDWYIGSKKRKEGELYTLYVSPHNPQKCYTPAHVEMTKIMYIGAGVLMLFAYIDILWQM